MVDCFLSTVHAMSSSKIFNLANGVKLRNALVLGVFFGDGGAVEYKVERGKVIQNYTN